MFWWFILTLNPPNASVHKFFVWFFFHPTQGLGKHPHEDPWGKKFSEDYYPERFSRAGTALAGPFTFILDGIQGDADFIASLFTLQRSVV